MRFESDVGIHGAELGGDDGPQFRHVVIISPIEGEDNLVSMRMLQPQNREWLMPPMLLAELGASMLSAVILGGDDAEAEVARENALLALRGGRPDPMYVDYGAEAAVARAQLNYDRRELTRAWQNNTAVYYRHSFGFSTVDHGVSNNSHLSRILVGSAVYRQQAGEADDYSYAFVSVHAINRGGVEAVSMELPPAMAYDVANGLLSMWRDYAPEASVAAMRQRIETLCRTRVDPSPVEKVRGFYAAPVVGGRKRTAAIEAAAVAAEATAVNADDLLDELTAAGPRR